MNFQKPLIVFLTGLGFFFFSTPSSAGDGRPESLRRVIVPVLDLRSEPKDAPDTYIHDPLQESQLLFGEKVRVHEIRGDWARVEGVGQKEFTHKKLWEGYPGWVRLAALEEGQPVVGARRAVVSRPWADIRSSEGGNSPRLMRAAFGSLVDVTAQKGSWYEILHQGGRRAWIRKRDVKLTDASAARESPLGANVWKYARSFLGVPYYWGGLSPYDPNYSSAVTGVDCSGLTHLCYRAAGRTIPRDSHEQWMKSTPLRRAQLRRGDLVFLANAEKPDKVVHVAMYVGGEFMIEGPGTGLKVRRVTFKKKLGMRLAQIESGAAIGSKVVYFGRPTGE